MKKRMQGLLFVFLLALLLIPLWVYKNSSFQQNTASQNAPLIEESMTGVTAVRFDNAGNIYQTLTMEQWSRYQGSFITHMVHPDLRIVGQDNTLWQISAHTGKGFHKDLGKPLEKIELRNNVTVKRMPSDPQYWLTLSTHSLLFFPESAKAHTEASIHIQGPHINMQAQGLEADLDKHSIEFLKRVTSVYIPT